MHHDLLHGEVLDPVLLKEFLLNPIPAPDAYQDDPICRDNLLLNQSMDEILMRRRIHVVLAVRMRIEHDKTCTRVSLSKCLDSCERYRMIAADQDSF